MNPDCKTGGKGSRKFFILMLAFVLCGAMAVTLFAADSTDDVEAFDPFDVEVDGVTYVVTSGPGSFGDYRGYLKIGHPDNVEQRIEDFVTATHPETAEEMKIRIVEIASEAYKGNISITSIEITSWVIEIGISAFEGCTNLEIVDNIAGGKSGIRNIGANAFKDCTSLENASFFAVDSPVWTVGANAFENCTSLNPAYYLPNLYILGDSAFKGSGLTSFVLSNSITSIGVGVFEDCVYLTSATLSSNPSVQERMFKNSGLTSIDFPGVMFGSIGKSAFEGCTSLVTATFPVSAGGTTLQSIGDSAFKDCTALEVLRLSPHIKKIGNNAFENCTSLELVTFGDRPELTEIGEAAFKGCIVLEDVRILYSPDAFQPLTRISMIGANAFEDCIALKSINLTPLISEIGDFAFQGTGLTSVSIPFYPTLGEGIFMNCVDLETVVFESPRTSITGTDVFAGCVKLDTVRMPSTVTAINSSAFNDCEALEIIAIPLGATIVGDETMDGRIIVWFSGVTAGVTAWISEGDVHMAIEMAYDEIADIVTAGFTEDEMNVVVLGEGHLRHMTIGTEKTVYVDVSIDDDGIIYIDGNSNWIRIPIADLVAAKETMDENPEIKELKIRTRDGTVSFDADVLQYIIDELNEREEDALTVSISRVVYVYAIPQAVQNVVGDRPVYSITMNTISTFGDGKLKISLKYDILEGEKPGRILIWHVDNSGVTTAHLCTYSEGYVRFETTHLSYYFVGYDDSPGNKVTFKVDGEVYKEYYLDIDELIVLPTDPVKESTIQYDYEFIGWIGYTDGMTVTGEQSFVAEFREIPREYEVTIINGDETIRKTLEYGTTIVLPTPSKTATAEFSYVFESWTNWTDGMTVSGDITITAVFTPVKNSYTVTFVNGDETTEAVLEYGASIALPTPSKTATAEFTYTFASWTNWTPGMTVTGNITITAVFTPVKNSYTVTFVNGDETIEEILDYGTLIVLPEPVKAATAEFSYVFESWTNWTSGMKVSGDVILTATFTQVKNSYTVTFVNGDETTEKTLEYDADIVLPEPVKTATAEFTYTFESWTNWTEGMKVSGDITFTAVFTSAKNSYTVTFVNGDETTEEILEYGAEIVLPEPTKAATAGSLYLFGSWTNWTVGMTVTGDVTLEANFVSVLAIDNDNIGDLADDDGKIVIGDDDSESVSISTDTINAVGDEMNGNSDAKELEIKTQDGSVTIDADVIGYIKDKLDERNEIALTVNMVRMDNALLSDVIRNVVGDRPVYSITMNTMSTFGDGKLKISLKYDLLENEDPEKILIWHISETGSVTAHPCTYSDGYVHFETTHLSYYFVGYDNASEPLDDGFPMEYIIGIAAVAIIALMAVVFLRKN